VTVVSNKEKMELASTLALETKKEKAQPIRRVFIPVFHRRWKKPGKAEKRPLGIPTIVSIEDGIRDRAQQCLVKYAIEPQWEATFEPNSYGFRPGRCCQDAIAGLWLSLKHGDRFILDADIQKCFDKIDHEKLLDKLNTIPIIRAHVKLWLKADIMEGSINRPKEPAIESIVGAPLVSIEDGKGRVISPLLANIALHGMETATKDHYAEVVYSGPKNLAKRHRRNRCGIIRYADDFVITAQTQEEILQLQEFIGKWLKDEAGLELSPEKTKVKRSSQGFDFLGFHLIYLLTDKGNRPKLKIHVSKTSKKKIIANTRGVFQKNKNASVSQLIQLLNPKIIGWCNYFRYSECTRDFKAVEYVIFGQLRAWVFRRRSKGLRSGTDIKNKYFPSNTTVVFNGVEHTGEWILVAKTPGPKGTMRRVFLAYPSWVRSRNYRKVKEAASPFDANHVYWTSRMGKYSG
jgi:RNA-directed DNA polymerase